MDTPVPRGGDEGGFALAEVLVSVVIVGITFAAILGGMATSINTSDLHHQQAQVEAVLNSAADHLKDPAVAKVACAKTSPQTPSYVTAAQSAATAQGWAATKVQITKIEYWNGDTYGPTCYDTATLGFLLPLQQITIRVDHPEGRDSVSLTFVKGRG